MVEKQKALNVIVQVMGPYVGENMALASAKGQCDKLGLHSETIDPGQFQKLLIRLSKAMRVFVGEKQAEEVVSEIESIISGNAI